MPQKKAPPFAKVATARLRDLIANRAITLKPVGRGLDRYNRVLAHVHVGNDDIGVPIITQGLATYYRPGCVDYVKGGGVKYDYDPRPYVEAETAARAAKRRMWGSGAVTLPCAVRGRKYGSKG